MGEKMGTFGESEGWKLTSKMHDYARLAEVAVCRANGMCVCVCARARARHTELNTSCRSS
jgi:hypothetical protein